MMIFQLNDFIRCAMIRLFCYLFISKAHESNNGIYWAIFASFTFICFADFVKWVWMEWFWLAANILKWGFWQRKFNYKPFKDELSGIFHPKIMIEEVSFHEVPFCFFPESITDNHQKIQINKFQKRIMTTICQWEQPTLCTKANTKRTIWIVMHLCAVSVYFHMALLGFWPFTFTNISACDWCTHACTCTVCCSSFNCLQLMKNSNACRTERRNDDDATHETNKLWTKK